MGARRDYVSMRGGLLIAALLLAVPAEAAKQAAVPNRFGAIAYHRASQSWGVSYDFARERDARVQALKQCGHRECEVVHKFKNGCAALADGPKIFTTASGATRDEAETKTLKRCNDAKCKLVAWACTR
jgi:alpha-ketoglutarate-dependent taurine dioxygenase